jgi:uncharacterized cupin superfamily protein
VSDSEAREQFGVKVLVRGEESAGALGVMGNWVPGHWGGPPLHRHDFDEGFQGLEGELTFQLDGELSTARAGGFAFAPRGSVHTFTNRSEAPAR